MSRKVVDGKIRNKERTKDKLIDAVGSILQEHGYAGLGINRIAKKAGVDKKLIYRYFVDVNGLIDAYLRKRDFWSILNDKVTENSVLSQNDFGEQLAKNLLTELLNHFDDKPEALKIIMWEISEKSDALNKLSLERELLGQELFSLTDPLFAGSRLDLRACFSILLAGVYYLNLHSNATGGEFCGIDLKKYEGKERIEDALKQLVSLCYDFVKKEDK